MKLDAYTNVDEIANVSVASLTNDEKAKLLKRLVYELKKDNLTHLDKFFELIDTFEYKHIRLDLIEQTIIPMMSNETQVILKKESLLRYKNKNETIDILTTNNVQYNFYKLDLAKKILKNMNSQEICALLIKCESNRQIRNYILDNYSDKIDYQTLLKVYKAYEVESIIKVFENLSYKKKIQFIKDNKESYDLLISRINDLKASDRLYLELSANKMNISQISKKDFIEFLNNYSNESDNFYFGDVCYFFDVKELKEITNYINNGKLKSYIESEIIYREYNSLNDEDKKEYFNKLDIRFIDRNFYLLSKDKNLFDKTFLLNKLENITINNERFAEYVLGVLSEEEMKKNNIKISLYAACELNKIGKDYIEKLLSNDDKQILLQRLILKADREGENFIYRDLLLELLKGTKGVKNVTLFNYVLSFEEVLGVVSSNNDLVDSIDFNKLNESQLLKLKDYALNNEKYIDVVLNKKEYVANDEFSKLQIEALSKYHKYRLPSCVNFKMLEDCLTNKESLINILPFACDNISLFKEIINRGLDENILMSLDDSSKLIELYKSIKDGNNEDLKRAFFINIDKVIKGKETLLELKSNNPLVMSTLNYKLLDVLEGKNLEYFARYADLKSLTNFKSESRELVSLIANRIIETRKYPDQMLQRCLEVISKLDNEKIEALKNEDIDKVIYLMNKNPIALSNDISEYEIKESEYCNDSINSEDIDKCKDAFFREKCKITLDDARRLINVYGKDINKLKEIYKDNNEVLKYLESLKRIEEVLKINSKDILVSLYSKTKPIIDYKFPFALEETLKIAYNREITQSIYKVKQEDLVNENVYKVKGEFNLLVSVIGAFIENKESINNPNENWNDNEKLVNHGICSSLISNGNLSFVYDKDKLIYGFNNLEDSSILDVASYDLSSNSNSINITTLKESEYRTSKGIASYTREGHSELIIERRKENSNDKRQPDYIVAIDEIRDIDYRASKEFNIPIVLLDTREIARYESEKLFNLYKETIANPTRESIDTLINSYHSNYAGLLTINPKLNSIYFNEKKFEKMLGDLLDNISNNNDLLNALKDSLEDEEKKRVLQSKRFYPFSFSKLKEKIDKNIKLLQQKNKRK